jgi:hypothetical protein
VAQVGVALAVVEVEPCVLPAGVGIELGGKPTTAADTSVAATVEAVGGAVVVRRPIPGRTTAGRSCHNLPLLCFLVGTDRIVCYDDIADKL